MKKFLLIPICVIICIMFISCDTNEGESSMKNTSELNNAVSVTFINDVTEADIWIMPQTEENLKTTLWGKATIKSLKEGEEKTVSVNDTQNGSFIVRIIDSDHGYYSARGITLKDGYTIHFKTDDRKYEATIDVIDNNGKTIFSKEAFVGALGAQ